MKFQQAVTAANVTTVQGGILPVGARFTHLALMALALGASACGGDQASEADSAPQTSAPTTTASSPAPAPSASLPAPASPAPAQANSALPTLQAPRINLAAIPTGSAGINFEKIATTTEVAPPIGGNFRTSCAFSHMAFDDPIVFPGQPGRAHLHAFFGNTGVNAASTSESIARTGNSTCFGGTVNRSAYWVPAMIDTRDGTPIKPAGAGFYYKHGNLPANQINPFPPGLRMIAGDASNSKSEGPFRYKCISDTVNEGYTHALTNCPVGASLWMEIFFPQCWDGRNLDSPDHKSHMAYTTGGRCPSTHPVGTPSITFNIIYDPVTFRDQMKTWRLSSDTYDPSLPAGLSAHGDWWNGWKVDIMDTWVTHCNRADRDCRSHLLGDGRMVF